MAVDLARDGAVALRKALSAPYDVVVLDRDLPELHGDDVCRTLAAERPDTKVLMLTAAAGVDDLVDGLALGADDYLSKPFRFAELVARTRALARRNGSPRPPVMTAGDVELDPARRVVTRAGQEIDLAPKELAVLEVLMAAEGAVVGPDELLERVWDEGIDPFTNTVRMTVMTLRRKLGDPPVVHTVRGAGYRI
jgi:DNA-binding response OmpR family regulator